MSDPDHEGKRTAVATGALLLLPALCCGLPLLIAGGALAGLGSVLGNPWVIGAAVALIVGVVVWRARRHTALTQRTRGAATNEGADLVEDCCGPHEAESAGSPASHAERAEKKGNDDQ